MKWDKLRIECNGKFENFNIREIVAVDDRCFHWELHCMLCAVIRCFFLCYLSPSQITMRIIRLLTASSGDEARETTITFCFRNPIQVIKCLRENSLKKYIFAIEAPQIPLNGDVSNSQPISISKSCVCTSKMSNVWRMALLIWTDMQMLPQKMLLWDARRNRAGLIDIRNDIADGQKQIQICICYYVVRAMCGYLSRKGSNNARIKLASQWVIPWTTWII